MGLVLAFGFAIRDLGFETFIWIMVDYGCVWRLRRDLVVRSYMSSAALHMHPSLYVFPRSRRCGTNTDPFFLHRIGFGLFNLVFSFLLKKGQVRLCSSIFHTLYSSSLRYLCLSLDPDRLFPIAAGFVTYISRTTSSPRPPFP